jgi:hypothetical protein
VFQPTLMPRQSVQNAIVCISPPFGGIRSLGFLRDVQLKWIFQDPEATALRQPLGNDRQLTPALQAKTAGHAVHERIQLMCVRTSGNMGGFL